MRRRFSERRTSNDPLDRSGVWRFRELLPSLNGDPVTLQENNVPLLDSREGAEYAGASNLAYLHLGMNPTASFKDAGMSVAISHARAGGARLAVCASTGNTAASMAAYAARAGMNALVLVPAGGVSEAKLAQTLDYGAKVVGIPGDFDRALEVVRALDPARFAIVNSINPLRIEGQKCAAFALLEARDWEAPNWLVLPGGNLGNTSAFGKGFREAHALGLIASAAADRRRAGRRCRTVRASLERRRRAATGESANVGDGDQDRRARFLEKGACGSSRIARHRARSFRR